MTKYQCVVENNIDDCHQYCGSCKNAGLGNANIKSSENNIDKGEKETIYTPVHIVDGSFVYLLRTNYQFHDVRHAFNRQSKNNSANQKIKDQAVVEYRTDLLEILFTIPTSYKDLCSLAKPEPDHVDG